MKAAAGLMVAPHLDPMDDDTVPGLLRSAIDFDPAYLVPDACRTTINRGGALPLPFNPSFLAYLFLVRLTPRSPHVCVSARLLLRSPQEGRQVFPPLV